MGTEVLRPHDFWNDGFRLPPPAVFHRRRNFYPQNSRPSRKPTLPPRSDQRRKSPSPSPSPFSSPAHSPPPSPTPKPAPPVKGPRRTASAVELHAHMQPENANSTRKGQSLDTIDATRMKRDMRKKCMNDGNNSDVYAGSAFFSSPAPSSLPQPSFLNERNTNNNIVGITKIISTAVKHDSATRDLRRMLGLD